MVDEWVQCTGARPPELYTKGTQRQTTPKQDKSRLRAAFYQSKVNKIGESNSAKAVVEDNDWTTIIQVTRWLLPTTSTTCSKKSRLTYNCYYLMQFQFLKLCQTGSSSVSQTASWDYPSYVYTRLWGPIISPTGFWKTYHTLSLLQ